MMSVPTEQNHIKRMNMKKRNGHLAFILYSLYMWERPTRCTLSLINLFQINYPLHTIIYKYLRQYTTILVTNATLFCSWRHVSAD